MIQSLLLQLRAGVKYLLSFTRPDWIINWWQMVGFSDTKQEAYFDLEKQFAEIKSNGKPLPRPGTGLPIEFAPVERIQFYDDIADDFFRRVLDMDYHDCFISDESTLWDFHDDESNEHLHRRIWNAYRVDVSDINDGNLVKIFDRIENRQ